MHIFLIKIIYKSNTSIPSDVLNSCMIKLIKVTFILEEDKESFNWLFKKANSEYPINADVTTNLVRPNKAINKALPIFRNSKF